MGEWIVDVINFQKIFGFCGLRGHIVEIRRDVTLVDDEQRTTECEDRARILGSRIRNILSNPLPCTAVKRESQYFPVTRRN